MNNTNVAAGGGASNLLIASGTGCYNPWTHPERVAVNEYPDRIEMVYLQYSRTKYTSWTPELGQRDPEPRCFKIVFSCVDGKWHKSEPIYGKILPATQQQYQFED